MEKLLNKISYLIYITLFIVFIESTIACALLFTGYTYKEFDQEKADEMLEYIKVNNRDYYDQLKNEDDPTYIEEYNELYEKKGHPLVIAGGFIMFALSFHTAIPLGVMLFWIKGEKKEEKEEETEEKTDEKKDEKKDKEPDKPDK